jgi:hypothetical protein
MLKCNLYYNSLVNDNIPCFVSSLGTCNQLMAMELQNLSQEFTLTKVMYTALEWLC